MIKSLALTIGASTLALAGFLMTVDAVDWLNTMPIFAQAPSADGQFGVFGPLLRTKTNFTFLHALIAAGSAVVIGFSILVLVWSFISKYLPITSRLRFVQPGEERASFVRVLAKRLMDKKRVTISDLIKYHQVKQDRRNNQDSSDASSSDVMKGISDQIEGLLTERERKIMERDKILIETVVAELEMLANEYMQIRIKKFERKIRKEVEAYGRRKKPSMVDTRIGAILSSVSLQDVQSELPNNVATKIYFDELNKRRFRRIKVQEAFEFLDGDNLAKQKKQFFDVLIKAFREPLTEEVITPFLTSELEAMRQMNRNDTWNQLTEDERRQRVDAALEKKLEEKRKGNQPEELNEQDKGEILINAKVKALTDRIGSMRDSYMDRILRELPESNRKSYELLVKFIQTEDETKKLKADLFDKLIKMSLANEQISKELARLGFSRSELRTLSIVNPETVQRAHNAQSAEGDRKQAQNQLYEQVDEFVANLNMSGAADEILKLQDPNEVANQLKKYGIFGWQSLVPITGEAWKIKTSDDQDAVMTFEDHQQLILKGLEAIKNSDFNFFRQRTLESEQIDTQLLAQFKNKYDLFSEREKSLLALALVMHDFGRVVSNTLHPITGGKLVEQILPKLGFDAPTVALIKNLTSRELEFGSLPWGEAIPEKVTEGLEAQGVDQKVFLQLMSFIYILDVSAVGNGKLTSTHLRNALFLQEPANLLKLKEGWAEVRASGLFIPEAGVTLDFEQGLAAENMETQLREEVLRNVDFKKFMTSVSFQRVVNLMREFVRLGHPENVSKLLYVFYELDKKAQVDLIELTSDRAEQAQVIAGELDKISWDELRQAKFELRVNEFLITKSNDSIPALILKLDFAENKQKAIIQIEETVQAINSRRSELRIEATGSREAFVEAVAEKEEMAREVLLDELLRSELRMGGAETVNRAIGDFLALNLGDIAPNAQMPQRVVIDLAHTSGFELRSVGDLFTGQSVVTARVSSEAEKARLEGERDALDISAEELRVVVGEDFDAIVLAERALLGTTSIDAVRHIMPLAGTERYYGAITRATLLQAVPGLNILSPQELSIPAKVHKISVQDLIFAMQTAEEVRALITQSA